MDIGDLIEITIEPWLAKSKGFDTSIISGEVRALTDKAVLLELDDGSQEWFPLSQIIDY